MTKDTNKIIKFLLILFILISVFLPTKSVCLQGDDWLIYNEKIGFSIDLPDDWIEIPPAVVKQYSQSISLKYRAGISFGAGYQRESKGWLTYPYILVHFIKTGKIPENKINEANDLLLKEAEESFSKATDIYKNSEIIDYSYNNKKRIFHITMKAHLNLINDDIWADTSCVYTETGLLFFYCYTLFDDNYNKSIMNWAIENIQLDEELIYKKSITTIPYFIRNLNWGKMLGKGLFGMAVVLFFYALYYFYQQLRKMSNKPEKDEELTVEIIAEKVDQIPNNKTIRQPSATDWFKRGLKFSKSGNYQDAINAYNNSINLDPNNLLAYYNRGLVYYKLGNYEQMLINLKISAKLGHEKSQTLLKSKGIDW